MFDDIREDIAAFKQRDPAATSTASVVINSPGMRAIWAYRRQHWWWTHGHPLFARWLSTRSRRKFGVEIHPGATIGRRFVIDHGMGIVVGETTIIGDDCMLYQGVTLGGTGKVSGKRHPTLGNGVTVGVGASVLGDITLGDRCKVGGGAVVVKDVPSDCTVVGVPGHVTTRCGERLRDRGRAGGATGVTRKGETCASCSSAENFERVIADREDRDHRQYMPDPIEVTVDALYARVAELEAKLDQLEQAQDAGAQSQAEPQAKRRPRRTARSEE